MIVRHRLARDAFETLCRGSGNTDLLARLRDTRLSRHLLYLRAILDVADGKTRQQAHLDANTASLRVVERHAPQAARAALSRPMTGAWAANCVRRLSGATVDACPLWIDLAHLGAIVIAAAVQGRIGEVECLVPVRQGKIVLPGLGSVQLPGGQPWRIAALRSMPDGGVLIHDSASDWLPLQSQGRWSPLRRLEYSAHGQGISLEFEELDPYRQPERSTDGPVGDATWRRWRDGFAACWEILTGRHPDSAEAIATMLSCLIPLESGKRTRGQSSTSRDANGALRMDLPSGPLDFAVTLIHEAEHNKLNALHGLVPLFEPTDNVFYSPWRDDPRPASGLLHGVYAFRAVAQFWAREHVGGTNRRAEFEFARVARQVHLGYSSLADAPLTAAGRHVAAATEGILHQWLKVTVSAEARRLAIDLGEAHHIEWLLRKSSKLDLSSANRLTLYRMARQWYIERDFAPGGEEADRFLIMGDYAQANARYADAVMGAGSSAWACAGLLITMERLHPTANPWRARPLLLQRVRDDYGLDPLSMPGRIQE